MFARLITLILSVSATAAVAQTFKEDFSEGLLASRWKVSTWTAPRHSNINIASFSADNVKVVNGVLRLKLSQFIQDGIVTSVGGEVMSTRKFGFGTYTFVMKASADKDGKPWSGSITGMGLYLLKSVTEIDIEVEGIPSRSMMTQTSTWEGEDKVETVKSSVGQPHDDFHTYVVIWTEDGIKFYRDGTLLANHQMIVPTAPANIFFNHWGTNDLKWGGTATARDRYMFIKSVTFTPNLKKSKPLN